MTIATEQRPIRPSPLIDPRLGLVKGPAAPKIVRKAALRAAPT